ncbi:permease [Paenibacillus flagellatus]|uniref:Permease n=1 Tax=Paenibacillus flagellatus TaxID=2211139 RepID=A0A2V5K2L2_9BACL|nr:permease [Paenibacillus flagellatus]PYI51793.1 hypothetical protein DLM86_23000 [Paenibacillus flagellatus]
MNSVSPSAGGRGSDSGKRTALLVVLFVLIAVIGLTYVKWWPYYQKAIKAATQHSIGSSIVAGKEGAAPPPSWQAAWDYAKSYYKAVWQAAVLGIVLGSLVQVLIPRQWLLRVLGRTTFGSTLAGGIASLPGMMCTCCAAPLAVGLRKQRVSVGAALAFWLGNPVLNPATLIFMTFVLSWKFTLLRIGFGLLLVFGVSYFANRFARGERVPDELLPERDAPQEERRPLAVRWLRAIGAMAVSVVPAYVVAVLVLGAARAWLFPAVGEANANGVLAIVGFSVAGMLFVIPTAAEIPIIQSLQSLGLGAGPAAALLLTLPAVSLPSLLMVAKAFPPRVIGFVAASVVVGGVACGLAGWIFL